MNWRGKLAVPREVLSREVGDELVILDLSSGIYFGLDPVGARIWQLVCAGASPEEVSVSLASEYEVDASNARQDVENLLAQLLERGLLKHAA